MARISKWKEVPAVNPPRIAVERAWKECMTACVEINRACSHLTASGNDELANAIRAAMAANMPRLQEGVVKNASRGSTKVEVLLFIASGVITAGVMAWGFWTIT